LVVFPDTTARGVITAALEVGIRVVPRKMKFVFHRNVHVRVLCPFPVTWAVSDEDEGARELISLIQKQFKGEEISPLIIPYKFRVSGPAIK
jgi:DNA-binding LacI/PurR family transcriptional regulator